MTNIRQPTVPSGGVDALADQISSRLNRLHSVASLAAFACEARRALEAYRAAIKHFPDTSAFISRAVEAPDQWSVMDDASADVLEFLAMELRAMSESVTEQACGLTYRQDPDGSQT